MMYVKGKSDGKRREVCHIAVDSSRPKTYSLGGTYGVHEAGHSNRHCLMMLCLSPGNWVKQIICQDRVKIVKLNKYGRILGEQT